MSDKCECEEGLPEWIMSYADMITILMAFFVVMYSMAGNKDTAKEEAVLKSLRNQFGPSMPGWGSLVPPMFNHRHASQVDLPYKGGTKDKSRNRGGADQRRSQQGDHQRVSAPWLGEQSRVGGVVYFADDSSTLTDLQEQSLKLIAAELGGKPQRIEIRGHTSRRVVNRKGQAQDHWDLAYARCRATMEYLTSLGIDPQRFRLGVAGENEPINDGQSSSPYAQNSRVDVFMLNEVVDTQARKPSPQGMPAGLNKPETKDPT